METRYISLEEAIETEERMCRGCPINRTSCDKCAVTTFARQLREIPAADVVPAPRWIPVKERLPTEEEKLYLCFAKGGYQRICLWTDDIFGLCSVLGSYKNTGAEWGWSVHTKPRYDEITHWMPLPEPPKEVQDV